MKRCTALLAIFLLCLAMPGLALAHSVYVFAWVEGTQICTESYYSPKNTVRGGTVTMADMAGNTLAQGLSGQDGVLCFALPAKAQALEFSVLAGAGHKGSFTLAEQALVAAMGNTAQTSTKPAEKTHTSQGVQVEAASTSAHPDTAQAPPAAPSEALIRAIVQEELRKQLSPLRQYLAEKLEATGPGIRDIVGGIGWLVGLGALGFWYSHRRNKH